MTSTRENRCKNKTGFSYTLFIVFSNPVLVFFNSYVCWSYICSMNTIFGMLRFSNNSTKSTELNHPSVIGKLKNESEGILRVVISPEYTKVSRTWLYKHEFYWWEFSYRMIPLFIILPFQNPPFWLMILKLSLSMSFSMDFSGWYSAGKYDLFILYI